VNKEVRVRRLLVFGIVLAVALGAIGVRVATAEEGSGPAFVKGGGPVTEDQVRQEMLAEGYSNPQVMREGRYFEATGTKDGQTEKLVVDQQTGRLRAGGEDSEDDD
jgi:hypothetical protein